MVDICLDVGDDVGQDLGIELPDLGVHVSAHRIGVQRVDPAHHQYELGLVLRADIVPVLLAHDDADIRLDVLDIAPAEERRDQVVIAAGEEGRAHGVGVRLITVHRVYIVQEKISRKFQMRTEL